MGFFFGRIHLLFINFFALCFYIFLDIIKLFAHPATQRMSVHPQLCCNILLFSMAYIQLDRESCIPVRYCLFITTLAVDRTVSLYVNYYSGIDIIRRAPISVVCSACACVRTRIALSV